MNATTRIIGIDPGLRRCGWGVIETSGNRLSFVAAGTVTPPHEGSLAERLAVLFADLGDVLDRFAPDEAAVEETFVNSGARSALILGQARGVALLAPAVRRMIPMPSGTWSSWAISLRRLRSAESVILREIPPPRPVLGISTE